MKDEIITSSLLNENTELKRKLRDIGLCLRKGEICYLTNDLTKKKKSRKNFMMISMKSY